MSFFLGGSKAKANKPTYTGLQLQTSSSVQALIIAWGANRFAPNLIWYNDFKTHKKKQKSGKGGGSSSSTYTYSASVIMALCEGTIGDVRTVYRDSDTNTTYSALGMTLFTGTNPQSPWGYVTTAHPSEARGYAGVAYLAVANYDLGESAALPNHSFEVLSRAFSTSIDGTDDADPAIVIDEFLTYPAFSIGMNRSVIDLDTLYSTDGTGAGDYSVQTYCAVQGYGISPVLSDQDTASDILQNWCDALNIAIVWTGYSLKFIPYDLTDIDGNGYKYRPLNTALATLTDADFVSSANDPVVGTRSDPADAYNDLILTINNRADSYNAAPVEWRDQGLIDQYGLRPGSTVAADFITRLDMATKCVTIMGQRLAYVRNSYKVSLGPGCIIYEPMDLLNLFDKKIGLIFAQVTDIEEQDDGSLQFTFDEISLSVTSNNVGFSAATYAGGGQDTGTPPGPVNAPLIFDVPANLTNGTPQIWAVVSGGDGTTYNKFWGGCNVYVSSDNVTFQAIGTVDSPARQGKTTSAIAVPTAQPDVTAVLGVDLTMSNGDLESVSASDAIGAKTLCYVGGELMSFETATLTATDKYNLTTLYRGQYQSAAVAHASGVDFARLDDNVFKYQLPLEFVGIPLFFKFQSFNIWNKATEDLSTCTTYGYTPTGLGFTVAPPTSCALSFAAITQTDGTSIITGTITVGTSVGPYLDHYDTQYSPDNGVTWHDAPAISATSTTTQFQPALATTNYKARARAVSSATGGIPSAYVTTGTVNSGDLVSAVPDAPTAIGGAGSNLSNTITWVPATTGTMATSFHIYVQHVVTGGAFGSATLVGQQQVGVNSFNHTGLGVSDGWTYWVVAHNAKGDSAPTAAEVLTTTAVGGGGASWRVGPIAGTGVAGQTITNANFAGLTVDQLFVIVNGQIWDGSTDYSISGTTITLTNGTNNPTGDVIIVRPLG